MSFLSDFGDVALPIAGAAGGFALGGPFGAAVGASLGSGVAGAISGPQRAAHAADMARQDWERNVAMQKEFAQNGIRWKVADAKAAGLHPLAALGASGASFSPMQSVGGGESNHWAETGQNISRAIAATRSNDEKDEMFARLRLENAGLQNDMLRSQIAQLNSAQLGPSMPSTSGLPTTMGGLVKEVPLERTSSAPGSPHQEVGHVSDVGWAKTATGLAPVPSKDVKERIEDQMIPEIQWGLRNNLLPTFDQKNQSIAPSKALLPRGADMWRYNILKQEWQPTTRREQSRPIWTPFK